MSKKKKIIIIVCAAVFAVLAAGGAIAYSQLPHPLSYDIDSVPFVGSEVQIVASEKDEVTIKKNSGEFKVLAFTDTHLDGSNDTSGMTVSNLVNNIVKEKPDLVVFNGDTVTSAFNKKRCNQLAEIFEKLGVYWAGGLGNHEGDNGFSVTREEMVEIFSSYEHCLMRKGADDVFGVANYALTILNKDNTVKQVYYFMDTGDEMSTELKSEYGIPVDDDPYDGTKPDQVKWYTDKNNALKAKYGSFKSTLFVHIPLYQMKSAAENEKFIYGEKLEGVCSSGFDSGLFEAMRTGGTTKAAFFGHDHLNCFGLKYKGILLGYLQPSGYGSYTALSKLNYEEKDWLQGYTAFELKENGSFDMYRVRNSSGEKE